jgi:uncharacterized protein YecE (DUF72 family)
MELRIGTSGYSYEDWRTVFYPDDLPKGKMLEYYSGFFDCVEINSTYYKIPHKTVFTHMVGMTPDQFQFVVKTNRNTTHNPTRDMKTNRESVQKLVESTAPLIEANKLSGFLAQFPYSFKNTPKNREYLVETKEYFGEYPLFIEFRNWTWNIPEVFDFLRKIKINYVNVDEPPIKGLIAPGNETTGPFGYVRFHGRNSTNWWKGTNITRYKYLYSESELDEWLIRIARLLKMTYKTYIFFNNHPQGQAVKNAKMLKEIMAHQIDILKK